MVKKNCHNLCSLHKWIILMSNVIPGEGGGGGGGGRGYVCIPRCTDIQINATSLLCTRNEIKQPIHVCHAFLALGK